MTYPQIVALIDSCRTQRWTTLDSFPALDEPWFTVMHNRALTPAGLQIDDYFIWRKPSSVLVIPRTNLGSFIVTCQYKYGADRIVVEFPGGQIAERESPRDASVRELAEETGYRVAQLKPLLTLVDDPTKQSGELYIFEGSGAEPAGEQRLDSTENVRVFEVSAAQLRALVADGYITTSSSVAAAALALQSEA